MLQVQVTLLSDIPKDTKWMCCKDSNIQGMFLGLRTDRGRPGGFLFVTDHSPRHCFIYGLIALRDKVSR